MGENRLIPAFLLVEITGPRMLLAVPKIEFDWLLWKGLCITLANGKEGGVEKKF